MTDRIPVPGGAVRPRWQHDLVRKSFEENESCSCSWTFLPGEDVANGVILSPLCAEHAFLVVDGNPTVELPTGYTP